MPQLNYRNPTDGTWVPITTIGPAGPSTPLTVTPVKTGNYTLAANELARADTTTGGITFTLPSSPAANTVIGAVLVAVSANNALTVTCGGTDVFDRTGGPTSIILNNAAQTLLAEYSVGVWVVTVRPLPSLNDGSYTTVDSATAGQTKVQLNDEIGVSSVILLGGGGKNLSADYTTNVALPACTYANGTSGVGATLTANANGTIVNLDSQTPAVNDLVLVIHQAAPLQNGLYKVTSVGSGSTPWVLTRDVNLDANTDFTNGATVTVARGNAAGRLARIRSGAYAMGTSGITIAPATTLGDVMWGVGRDRTLTSDDFDTFSGATAAPGTGNSLHVNGMRGIIYGNGTGAQLSQADVTVSGGELVTGVLQLETGTTTTGFMLYSAMATAVPFDGTKRWEMFARFKIPTISTGTETFNIKIGFFSGSDGNPTDGVYWEARQGQTNWLAVGRAASTETTADTGNAYNTGFKGFQLICPGDGTAYFYSGAVQVANITTNIPTASVLPAFCIVKSAGTTTRTLRMDMLGVDVPSTGNRINFLTP